MQPKRHQFSVALAILAMCVTSAQAQRSPENRGEDLVGRHCAMCHAIGRSGTSPDAKAPPFRALGQRMPLESLESPLGKGVLSGHPEMPEFVFPQQDVAAILRYLRSIQER
jgi:cytochrome c